MNDTLLFLIGMAAGAALAAGALWVGLVYYLNRNWP